MILPYFDSANAIIRKIFSLIFNNIPQSFTDIFGKKNPALGTTCSVCGELKIYGLFATIFCISKSTSPILISSWGIGFTVKKYVGIVEKFQLNFIKTSHILTEIYGRYVIKSSGMSKTAILGIETLGRSMGQIVLLLSNLAHYNHKYIFT